jgi:hypothetical protein
MESQAGFTCPIQSSAPHIADDEQALNCADNKLRQAANELETGDDPDRFKEQPRKVAKQKPVVGKME